MRSLMASAASKWAIAGSSSPRTCALRAPEPLDQAPPCVAPSFSHFGGMVS